MPHLSETLPDKNGLLRTLSTHNSRHVWCDRCCRVFTFSKAKLAHIQSSYFHNPCTPCPNRPDFLSRSTLRDHYNSHHFHCGGCTIVFNYPGWLQNHHCKAHCHCDDCREFLENSNTLRMVWLFLLSSLIIRQGKKLALPSSCSASNATSPGHSSAIANTAMSFSKRSRECSSTSKDALAHPALLTGTSMT